MGLLYNYRQKTCAMSLSELRLDLVFVFFVYGLAFFSMGIALTLETLRAPRLAERRVLRPLAVFGLLHGTHEWMEIILLQGIWVGLPFPQELSWLRVGWLAISFVPLVLFGALLLSAQGSRPGFLYLAAGLLALYLLLLALNARIDPAHFLGRADALARYVLAVPGGVLAWLALRLRARGVSAEGRKDLASHFRWAALGFGIYGMTQIFVAPMDMLPARFLNAEVFQGLFGFPVQVVRATMAILVTASLIRAITVVEREREEQLLAAQKARLEALEQVQRDLVAREALRRELLRHTVIAQEDERSRIARELHDETAQFLTALNLSMATLQTWLAGQPEAQKLLDHLQALTRQMAQRIYRMVRDLRPAQLDDLGLVAALQYLADEERKSTGLEVAVRVEGPRQRMDHLVETVLFRVAQEALTNVARHSRCGQATVDLTFEPRQVILRIADPGVGFSLDERKPLRRGWGLAGMRERAESVGGQLRLQSAPGKGTLVEVAVPLAEAERLDLEESIHEHHSRDAG